MTLDTLVLLFTIGCLTQGCCVIHATNAGKTWETFSDYKAAYIFENQLVIIYTVTNPLAKAEPSKISDRWASIDLVSQQPLQAKPPLRLHRFPLPARIREKGQPVQIVQAAAALPKGQPLSIKVRDPGVFFILPVMLPLAVAGDILFSPFEFIKPLGLWGDKSLFELALDSDPWKHPPNHNNAVEPTSALTGARGSP
jgi:hypothetical protein